MHYFVFVQFLWGSQFAQFCVVCTIWRALPVACLLLVLLALSSAELAEMAMETCIDRWLWCVHMLTCELHISAYDACVYLFMNTQRCYVAFRCKWSVFEQLYVSHAFAVLCSDFSTLPALTFQGRPLCPQSLCGALNLMSWAYAKSYISKCGRCLQGQLPRVYLRLA